MNTTAETATATTWHGLTRIGLGPTPTIKPHGETRPPLTDRQAEVVAFIHDHYVELGYSPSLRDIIAEFGFSSTNAVVCHLKAIRKKGYLRWAETTARSIVLI